MFWYAPITTDFDSFAIVLTIRSYSSINIVLLLGTLLLLCIMHNLILFNYGILNRMMESRYRHTSLESDITGRSLYQFKCVFSIIRHK